MANRTLVYAGSEAGALYRKEASAEGWEQLSDDDAGPTDNGLVSRPQARAIAIHPQKPNVVYVGTQRGVYRSVDGGDHWERMDLSEGRTVWSIIFQPTDPQVMYLGTEGSEVYRSGDGGESWQFQGAISNPDAVQMTFSTRILGLAMEPAKPDNMYAALEVGGVARSFDGGKSWEMANRDFAGDVDLLDLHGVAVGSPGGDAVFISNRTGVWRSRDRGDNWENLRFERFSEIMYSRGIRSAPNDPNTLYACVGRNFGSEEGGVMRTTDLGDTWQRFDQGVSPRSTTFGIGINPQRPEQVYFCTRNGQVFGTHDDGDTWKEHALPESAKDVISVACASA